MKRKNLILILALNICFFLGCSPGKGKISGVVTYYFNDNLQFVPDVGSKVYFVHSSDIKNKDVYKTTNDLLIFCSTLEFRNVWLDYKRSNETPDPDLMKRIQQFHINDTAYFNAQDRKFARQLIEIENAAKITKTVDANGNYSAELEAGEYFVLIKSSHRTAISLCEIDGKPYFKRINLKANTEENISPKFSEF